MFAVIDPEVRFAKIELTPAARFKLDIFAEGFGALWGKFDCNSLVLPQF